MAAKLNVLIVSSRLIEIQYAKFRYEEKRHELFSEGVVRNIPISLYIKKFPHERNSAQRIKYNIILQFPQWNVTHGYESQRQNRVPNLTDGLLF